MEAPAGQVGPYRLLDVLGRGGMGVVYRARHERTGDIVALKTVQRASELLLSSFRREIHALGRIEHPGVVRILAEGVEDDMPWYAMELIDGEPLRRFVDASPSEGTAGALAIVRKLCTPLAALHGEGLVHRDLKPENVLVRRDGTPVLLDFGLVSRFTGVRNREALDVAGAVVGTVAYSAPEQALGELVDARADLYSIGCILYEILTSRPPFVGPIARVVMGHVRDNPVRPSDIAPGVDPAVEAIVLRLLAKVPSERFGYAEDVDEALAAVGVEGWPLPSVRPRPYLYRPGFAGRSELLERIEERISTPRGGLLFVSGESGSGKTRFAIEIARRAADNGVRVLAGECTPPSPGSDTTSQTPFGALVAPLEALVDRCRERGALETERVLGPNARALEPYAPSVARLPGVVGAPPPAELPAEAARLRLFSILSEAFLSLAEDSPLLLVLDDLQWADGLTLGFLDFVSRTDRFALGKVLLLGLHRSDEVGGGLRRVLAMQGADRVELEQLSAGAVRSIVRDMLALDPAPSELSAFLLRVSGGNPFFVAEYLRAAVDEGVLARDAAGRWRAGGGVTIDYDQLGLPGSLNALVERRIVGLPEQVRAFAASAAVLGREASIAVVRATAGIEERLAYEVVAELLRRNVMDEVATGRLRFAHDSLREHSYALLDSDRRIELHGRAARALESIGDAPHAILARHWREAGDRVRARDHYLLAARDALDKFALDEAILLYDSCIALFDGSEPALVSIRTEMAHDALRVIGRNDDALAALDAALAHARTCGDLSAEAATLRSLGIIYWETGHVEESRSMLESALEIARRLDARQLEAQTLDALANVVADRGPLEEAHALYEQALVAHRETGSRRGEGSTLHNLSALVFHMGRFDEAERLCEQAIEIHRATNNRRFEGMSTVHLAILRHVRGYPAEALALFEAAGIIQREIGDKRNEGITLQNLGVSWFREGGLEEARSYLRRALAIHNEVGNRRYEAIAHMELAAVERRLGHYTEAHMLLGRAQAALRDLGDEINLAMCFCERGHLALAKGGSGRPYLDSARALFEAIHASKESELGTAVARLLAAIEAAETGRALSHGEAVASGR